MFQRKNFLTNKARGQSDTPLFEIGRATHQQGVLLSSILSEFYCSAKLAATFASIVSAKTNGRPLVIIGQRNAFIPDLPLLFPAAAAGLAPVVACSTLLNTLQDYYSFLSFARSLSDTPALDLPDQASTHAELHQLQNVWLKVCALANLVVHHVYDVERLEDPARKVMLMSIQQLIVAAKNGNSPCVRSNGTVFIPGWLEERREVRHPRGWRVWIVYDGRREAATLQDISTGGMGLAFCDPQPVGSQISVAFPDGRCLTGIVTWAKDQRIGARFLQPLLKSDPLITAGDAIGDISTKN